MGSRSGIILQTKFNDLPDKVVNHVALATKGDAAILASGGNAAQVVKDAQGCWTNTSKHSGEHVSSKFALIRQMLTTMVDPHLTINRNRQGECDLL